MRVPETGPRVPVRYTDRMPPIDVDARVIANQRLSRDYNVLTLSAAEVGARTEAGQFSGDRRNYAGTIVTRKGEYVGRPAVDHRPSRLRCIRVHRCPIPSMNLPNSAGSIRTTWRSSG